MKITTVVGLAMLIGLFSHFAIADVQTKDKSITITGTVTLIDEDEKGNPVSIAIEVTIEDEEVGYILEYYYVVNDKKGKELFVDINKKVTVTGDRSEDEDGNKLITVKTFKVLKSEAEPPEDDDVF